jgi:hypothetical protein
MYSLSSSIVWFTKDISLLVLILAFALAVIVAGWITLTSWAAWHDERKWRSAREKNLPASIHKIVCCLEVGDHSIPGLMVPCNAHANHVLVRVGDDGTLLGVGFVCEMHAHALRDYGNNLETDRGDLYLDPRNMESERDCGCSESPIMLSIGNDDSDFSDETEN